MKKMLRVKVASDPVSQSQGLMDVEDLPEDEGMLFVFRRPQQLSFWGLNTYIPLDIAFIDHQNTIRKISKIVPHSLHAVTSDVPCQFVIEANDGYFQKSEVGVGDKINILDDEGEVVAGIIYSDPTRAIVTFQSNSQKDIKSILQKIKESQSIPPDKVDKPGTQPVGEPITEQVGNTSLPVLDTKDLQSILEDSFDEDEQKPQQQPGEAPLNEALPAAPEAPEQPEEQSQEEQPEPEKEYPVFTTAYQAMAWAQQNDEVVRMSYTTIHGRALVRDVEPHGTFHAKSSHHEVLVVFDETVNDIRAFILTNISKWAFVGRKFNKKFIVKP